MATRPKTGGRKPGVPNKVTSDLRKIAQQYTEEAFTSLLGVMRGSASDQARVAAVKEIFDRGWGKATQPIEGTEDGPPIGLIVKLVKAK